jgi:hypothetical protein
MDLSLKIEALYHRDLRIAIADQVLKILMMPLRKLPPCPVRSSFLINVLENGSIKVPAACVPPPPVSSLFSTGSLRRDSSVHSIKSRSYSALLVTLDAQAANETPASNSVSADSKPDQNNLQAQLQRKLKNMGSEREDGKAYNELNFSKNLVLRHSFLSRYQ